MKQNKDRKVPQVMVKGVKYDIVPSLDGGCIAQLCGGNECVALYNQTLCASFPDCMEGRGVVYLRKGTWK